jgi:hypothetical protein
MRGGWFECDGGDGGVRMGKEAHESRVALLGYIDGLDVVVVA